MRIALSGKFYSGKSTAAEVLVREFGFTKLALADELKAMAAEIVYFLRECAGLQHAGALLDKTTPLGRAWLQWLGTDLIRKRDADFWAKQLIRRLSNEAEALRNVVVDDMRFRNEALLLRDAGFKLVRIEATRGVRHRRAAALGVELSPEREYHPSETDLDDFPLWDAIINGDVPIQAFRQSIRAMIKELEARS